MIFCVTAIEIPLRRAIYVNVNYINTRAGKTGTGKEGDL